MITRKVILVFGIWGVGKSWYSDKFIKENPEYILVDCHSIDQFIRECKKYEYVIGDYYFINDWNAERLRKELGCDVEIRVLIDSPKNITYRQIFYKQHMSDVSLFSSEKLYTQDYKFLIDGQQAKWITLSQNGISLKKHIEWMKTQTGYDYGYHEMDILGFHIGKEGYSTNYKEWELIKNLTDWKYKIVLDIGCFHGAFCQEAWKMDAYPIGIDIHPHALYSASIFAYLKKMDIVFIKADVNKEFPNIGANLGLCMNVLHHIKDQDFLLRKLSNIPTVIFSIKEDDINKIENYFILTKKLISPKQGRLICVATPIKK
jgi:SAM-dependent methyltransferase